MADWTAITVALSTSTVTAAATVVAAIIARQARDAGRENTARLISVEAKVDPRQERLIERTVTKVAKAHPELIEHALADHFVREVLEALLEGRTD